MCDLERQTQGIDEPLLSFIYAIEMLYRRAQPNESESGKVSRVLRQVNPTFRQLLRWLEFKSLAEMAKRAPHFKAMARMDSRYDRPPPPNELFEANTGWESKKPSDSKGPRNDRHRSHKDRRDKHRSAHRDDSDKGGREDRKEEKAGSNRSKQKGHMGNKGGVPKGESEAPEKTNPKPAKADDAKTSKTEDKAQRNKTQRRTSCYYCEKEEHWKDQCPEPPKSKLKSKN